MSLILLAGLVIGLFILLLFSLAKARGQLPPRVGDFGHKDPLLGDQEPVQVANLGEGVKLLGKYEDQ